MSTAWLSLGANIGNPKGQINTALDHLENHSDIRIIARSAIMQTSAWGKTEQPDFFNITLEINTKMLPLELLDACQSIENQLGRVRKEKWGPRLIDIDIIAFERLVMASERLTLPHIHAHERAFVMDPLGDISPETANWITQTANDPKI